MTSDVHHTAFGQVTFLGKGKQAIAVVEGHSHALAVVSEIGDDGNGDKLAVLTVSDRSVENATLEGASIEVSVRFGLSQSLPLIKNIKEESRW